MATCLAAYYSSSPAGFRACVRADLSELCRIVAVSGWLTAPELIDSAVVISFLERGGKIMIRNSWALALLSFAMLAPQTVTAAKADVVIQSPSVFTFGAPLRVVRTQSNFMLTPLQTVPVMQDRTIIMQQSMPQAQTITNSVVLERNIGDVSDFKHRLQMLSDQIDLNEQSGWLTGDAAAGLRARQQELTATLDGIAANGTLTRETNDSLEKQINVLNQDVADAAAHAGSH